MDVWNKWRRNEGMRKHVCRNVCRSVPADGVKCDERVPVREHKTRGPHGTPRLFSPLLYQLSYLAEIGEGR